MAEYVLNNDFKPAIVIPVYNHEAAIENTLNKVLKYGYPVVLVNDGSHEKCRNVLEKLAQKHREAVYLVQLDVNKGKGGAVKAGMRFLLSQGFSHALQVDADGQHNISDLPLFIEMAKKEQSSLICGAPIYDASVPKHRYYSRYLTHVWVWINTLSFDIKDSMCGFRVYPLDKICKQLDRNDCGNRMSFDTEVVVRWLWSGNKVTNLPTKVLYPKDGVSHFKAVKDNVLISWMHTRLFFGMVLRLPVILWNKRHD
ncbi:glycosyltransferase family 2 protein [Marinomonas sp. 5E14-1]|uniref:glycosyltransferase family 2 protein n=1 Tax=Marinomonas sp. 5E14-1 TaxID=3153922 RepID=UPI0032634735